jgi:hypothetical protein
MAQDPTDSSESILKESIASIEKEARSQIARARNLRWSNSVFTFASAILGVGAPTLVTYFAQDPAAGIMKFVAILVAAFAGATTILITTFRWGERYGQSSLAAISLQELASSTKLRLQDAKRTSKPEALPEVLHRINHESQKQMFEILRRVIQNEAVLFSKTPDSFAAPNTTGTSGQIPHVKPAA